MVSIWDVEIVDDSADDECPEGCTCFGCWANRQDAIDDDD